MKAMRLAESGGPALAEDDIPRPQPGPDEALIQVYAAGVTPSEVLWYPTTHTKTGGTRAGAVPCHEFSGVIAGLGPDVAGVEVGQEVYGMNDWFAEGALAEYCVTQPGSIAPKPSRLTHNQAASVPIGALTAWQGLFDRAKLQPDDRVLVHGGAGAVGVYAVQLAHRHGARVIATASARNLDFVRQLGAERVIDYHAGRFEDFVHDLSVVFDTVGGETLQRSWSLLKPEGRMVTVAAANEAGNDQRVKDAFFIVEPKREQLLEIARLLQDGILQPVLDAALPFAQAPRAFAGEVKKRLGRGKLVITVSEQSLAADYPE